eukprot:gene10852-12839_t
MSAPGSLSMFEGAEAQSLELSRTGQADAAAGALITMLQDAPPLRSQLRSQHPLVAPAEGGKDVEDSRGSESTSGGVALVSGDKSFASVLDEMHQLSTLKNKLLQRSSVKIFFKLQLQTTFTAKCAPGYVGTVVPFDKDSK